MSEHAQEPSTGLNLEQRALIDGFYEGLRPTDERDVAAFDQAGAEMRHNLSLCSLKIVTDEQYFTACVSALVAVTNFRKHVQDGMSLAVAEEVILKQFASLRPDTLR